LRGWIVCAACGAKIKKNRTRCLRCGEPLVAADSNPEEQKPRHRQPSVRTVILIGAGCLTFAGVSGTFFFFGGGPVSSPVQTVAASSPTATSEARIPEPGSVRPQPTLRAEPVVAAFDERRGGVSAYKRGDIDGAFVRFTKAVETNPDDPEALNNLGQMLVRKGRVEEAIPQFDRAIRIAPDKWAYHFNRARAYSELKEWGRAVAGYRDAAKLFPEDYATQFNMAKALQANGDLTGAIAAYERAIELAPGQADFHLSHGLALEAAHHPSDAVDAYKRFLMLDPDSPEAKKVEARIVALTPATVSTP
jgi:Flp pilus assembly protein TadD